MKINEKNVAIIQARILDTYKTSYQKREALPSFEPFAKMKNIREVYKALANIAKSRNYRIKDFNAAMRGETDAHQGLISFPSPITPQEITQNAFEALLWDFVSEWEYDYYDQDPKPSLTAADFYHASDSTSYEDQCFASGDF